MKLRELPKPEVFKSGVDENNRKKFSFSNNAKKYRIMSSLIYKYKIRAIIREISTNAIDGHLAAGNTGSFDVHIPSTLEPWFSVRDYGTGLCHDDIESIYTVYFESTKTDDPDAIGALGLGSKSPFCYSEAFTVDSVFQGVKRSYVAYLENDEPFIDLVNTTETNEPSGILVKVPVKLEDIGGWETEAHRIYESFGAIRPNFIGVSLDINYQNNDPDPVTGIITHTSSYSKGLYARMGGIMYPIDFNIYQNSLLSFNMNSSDTYIMEFALGELDFMPSREELSLDRITLAKIKERIEGVNQVYHDELVLQFEQCNTAREKLVFYHTRTHSIQNYMNTQYASNGLFAINDMSPADAKSTIANVQSTNYEYLTGVWANRYDGARACEFRQIGRHTSHRHETQRKMRIDRITDPWEQKKLYIVSNVGKGYKKQLVGYCLLNNINTIYCVHKPAKEDGLKDFIEYFMFDESEIVYLDISKMNEELEQYKTSYPKTKLSSYSDRESVKSPTLNRYYLDGENVVREDLYYTKQQFVDMKPEYALRVYGVDDYDKLDTNGNTCFDYTQIMDPSYRYKLKRIMQIAGITSFVTVRNSLWDRIGQSNVMCLDDKLRGIFIDYANQLKENEYSTFESKQYSQEVTYLDTYFGIRLDKLVKNRYNEPLYTTLKTLCYHVLRIDETDKKFSSAMKKFRERNNKMKDRVDLAFKKFTELNPAIAQIISCMTYSMNSQSTGFKKPEVVENVNSLVRWK